MKRTILAAFAAVLLSACSATTSSIYPVDWNHALTANPYAIMANGNHVADVWEHSPGDWCWREMRQGATKAYCGYGNQYVAAHYAMPKGMLNIPGRPTR